ncbi:MAG: M48 family metalloprotease [Leptolyngbya sp. SIO1D8]|nr:M48 family metalloprotease [Leptolyngbya sp. SIO1D8]
MSELPPSSSKASFSSERSPEAILKQGLAALQQKDYNTAVQYLSKLQQDFSASGAIRLKARIGLIKALRGDGQIPEAIALCQKLESHPQSKIQQWAQTTLAKLTAISPAQQAPERTPDLSGFQPLESVSTLHSSEEVLSSNAPPASAETPSFTASVEMPAETPAANITQDQTGVSSAESVTTPESIAKEGELEVPATSLFHYERLNSTYSQAEPSQLTPSSNSEIEDSVTVPPSATAPSSAPDTETPKYWQFQYAGRLKQLRTLPPDKWELVKLWGIQVITAVALFWVCRAVVQWVLVQFARILSLFSGLVPIRLGWFSQEHTFLVLLGLGILLLASPWLLDWLLQKGYGQKPLSIQKLKQTHPEGCRLLRRIAQQRGWLLPELRELPVEAPLIFSYGWLPRYSRIVVSRGLLSRLEDDEFATFIGYELTHLTTGILSLMSLVATLLQLLHQSYWQTAQWGDRHRNRFIKVVAAALSAVSYGLYWIGHKVSISLSRMRVLLCDRQTVAWTGNPNALVRALIKVEGGIAEAICQAGYTPPLIESTQLLTPYGYETAITLGSIYPSAEFSQLLNWDIQNPYRHWLTFNSSHPLLGERLTRLTNYALKWQLMPEIPPPNTTAQISLRGKAAFWDYWLPFLMQISPYIGPLLGILVALLLWFLGGVFNPLGVWQVSWLYGDQALLGGSLFLGLGIGIMLRINRYFPDIVPKNRLTPPTLMSILKNPMALPTDSRPVRFKGTLIGRSGIANWFGQDLMLKTPTGLLKLHFLSSLGAIGNLFIHPKHPTDWIGRAIEVQGWLRRGAIAWLDIDYLLQAGKVIARSNHPAWSVILSLVACGLGLRTLLQI